MLSQVGEKWRKQEYLSKKSVQTIETLHMHLIKNTRHRACYAVVIETIYSLEPFNLKDKIICSFFKKNK